MNLKNSLQHFKIIIHVAKGFILCMCLWLFDGWFLWFCCCCFVLFFNLKVLLNHMFKIFPKFMQAGDLSLKNNS